MKRLLVLIFFLALSTGLLTAPPPVGPLGDNLDKWMIGIYPSWWNWPADQRETMRSLSASAIDKYNWFPDIYKDPKKHFTIYPESWTKNIGE